MYTVFSSDFAKSRSPGLLPLLLSDYARKIAYFALVTIDFFTGRDAFFPSTPNNWVENTQKSSYYVWTHVEITAQNIVIPRH